MTTTAFASWTDKNMKKWPQTGAFTLYPWKNLRLYFKLSDYCMKNFQNFFYNVGFQVATDAFPEYTKIREYYSG